MNKKTRRKDPAPTHLVKVILSQANSQWKCFIIASYQLKIITYQSLRFLLTAFLYVEISVATVQTIFRLFSLRFTTEKILKNRNANIVVQIVIAAKHDVYKN